MLELLTRYQLPLAPFCSLPVSQFALCATKNIRKACGGGSLKDTTKRTWIPKWLKIVAFLPEHSIKLGPKSVIYTSRRYDDLQSKTIVGTVFALSPLNVDKSRNDINTWLLRREKDNSKATLRGRGSRHYS